MVTSKLPSSTRRWLAAILLAAHAGGCAATVSDADRQNARLHYDMAITSLNHGDLRGALRELLATIELDPTLPQAHNALGLVYHAMDRKDDALEHYEQAIKLKPSFSDAYNNMGGLLIDMRRYDDAIASFKVALSDILYATPSLAEGNMGWAYYQKGEVELGERHLRNAVATNPKFCRGYEWLAVIGLETQKPEQTVANARRFDKHCAADPDIVKLLKPTDLRRMQYYLAMGYLKQGDRDAAKRALVECAVVDATDDFSQKCVQTLRAMP